MATSSQFVFDVDDFERQVVERSREIPVLVDFWAAWCGPCRMLTPRLERLADEFGGAFVLAKLNTEAHQGVAMRYQIRSIPDVRLFRGGDVVDGFVGALPDDRVRAFLRKHCPSEAQTLIQEGLKLLSDSELDAAEARLSRALELDATQSAAHLGMARIETTRGRYDQAREHLSQIHPTADERDAASHLEQVLKMARDASSIGTEDELRTRLDSDPDDHEARYALGAHHLAAGRHRRALDAFFDIAERDRKWHDQAARKAMLTIFGVIGVRHPMADEYRQKLVFIY